MAATVLTMPGPANETWVNNTAQRARWKLAIKRAVDVSGSAMALVGLSPVMLLIALMVKLQDGGPVIYRRRVVGPKGEFDAFKFRSMRADADQVLKADPELRRLFEINYKLRNDPRVTAVGAVIRRHSLDELPQLLNVLLGQMTLVGPRTITAPELTKYRDHASLLMSVKPGLTGYWQVNGRHRVSYEERVKMDVHYIKNWSLAMDLRILLETPVKVLKAEGAF
ncbi:MAG: sugar transferase [Acidobacteriales bacterium]|nr:sugar transferase [Terriglobales bacterium]